MNLFNPLAFFYFFCFVFYYNDSSWDFRNSVNLFSELLESAELGLGFGSFYGFSWSLLGVFLLFRRGFNFLLEQVCD